MAASIEFAVLPCFAFGGGRAGWECSLGELSTGWSLPTLGPYCMSLVSFCARAPRIFHVALLRIWWGAFWLGICLHGEVDAG